MSTWTVDADFVIQTVLPLLGRPSLIVDAVCEVMHQNLATVLAGINDLHAGTDEDPRPFPTAAIPKAFRWAGEDLGSYDNPELWPQLLAATSVSVDEFGHGHQDIAVLQVTCAYPPAITRMQLRYAMDVAAAAQGLLRHPNFAGYFENPSTGQQCWTYMLPTGFRMVPSDWKLYSGYIATFTVHQTPGQERW